MQAGMDSGEVVGELERRSQTLQEDHRHPHSQHPHHNSLTYSEAGMESVLHLWCVDGMQMATRSGVELSSRGVAKKGE